MNFETTKRPVVDDRPIDALLAGYAARTLAPPFLAMIAAHLEIVPDNRSYVAALEAVHGIFLSSLDPVPLTGRDRRLVNIFASVADDVHADAAVVRPREFSRMEVAPAALRDFLGGDVASLAFREVVTGLEQAVVATGDYGEASVLRCRANHNFRSHGHRGIEAVLVLSGSYSDAGGTYGRGQIAVVDETRHHQPVAGPDGLVCFMVSQDMLSAKNPVTHFLSRVLGG